MPEDSTKHIRYTGNIVPYFKFLVSARAGTLIIYEAYGPKVRQPGKLVRLSDLSYLAYADVCRTTPGCSPRSIKNLVIKDIQNDSTNLIVKRARNDAADQGQSRVKSFNADTEAGKALLGSVNGLAAPWMIIDHPKWFYAITVAKVHSYRSTTFNQYSLIFEFGAIPNSGPPPPPDPHEPATTGAGEDPLFSHATDVPMPDAPAPNPEPNYPNPMTIDAPAPTDTNHPMPDAPHLPNSVSSPVPSDTDHPMPDAPPSRRRRRWIVAKAAAVPMPTIAQTDAYSMEVPTAAPAA